MLKSLDSLVISLFYPKIGKTKVLRMTLKQDSVKISYVFTLQKKRIDLYFLNEESLSNQMSFSVFLTYYFPILIYRSIGDKKKVSFSDMFILIFRRNVYEIEFLFIFYFPGTHHKFTKTGHRTWRYLSDRFLIPHTQ